MNKKAPQIFYLDSREEEFNLVKSIQKQLNNHKYLKVLDEATKAKNKFPGNQFFYIMASIAYLQINQPKNALIILLEAEKNIPNDYQIKFHLAKTYENLNDYLKAEECYRSALDNVEINDNDFRSNIFDDLAALLMVQERKDEALECWKSALMENPKNINAQNNLRNFTNQSRIPAESNKFFEDSEWDEINDMFPFLPEDGLLLVMYGSVALLAAGMPGDRLLEILDTGDYDEEEEELMYWTFEIAVLVMQSLVVKNKKEKFAFLEEAKDIAEEFIEEDVDSVISLIQATLKKEFIDKPKAGKRSKK